MKATPQMNVGDDFRQVDDPIANFEADICRVIRFPIFTLVELFIPVSSNLLAVVVSIVVCYFKNNNL